MARLTAADHVERALRRGAVESVTVISLSTCGACRQLVKYGQRTWCVKYWSEARPLRFVYHRHHCRACMPDDALVLLALKGDSCS